MKKRILIGNWSRNRIPVTSLLQVVDDRLGQSSSDVDSVHNGTNTQIDRKYTNTHPKTLSGYSGWRAPRNGPRQRLYTLKRTNIKEKSVQ